MTRRENNGAVATATASTGGIGFFGLLTIVLIVLKVGAFDTVVVGWSWWLVLSPLVVGFGISMLVLLFIAIIIFVKAWGEVK